MRRVSAAEWVGFQYRLAQATKRDAQSIQLPTLWMENDAGERWVPDFDNDQFDPPPGRGFKYQWSRDPLTLNENCLKIVQRAEVDACPHEEEHVRKTYGWIDGIEGRECASCGGSQTRNVNEPWAAEWDASGSRPLMSGGSSYPPDLVLALTRPSPDELAKMAERGFGPPFVFGLGDAIILAARNCERCMNALAHRYGLGWGYARGSKDWDEAGTRCFICKNPQTWGWLEQGKP